MWSVTTSYRIGTRFSKERWNNAAGTRRHPRSSTLAGRSRQTIYREHERFGFPLLPGLPGGVDHYRKDAVPGSSAPSSSRRTTHAAGSGGGQQATFEVGQPRGPARPRRARQTDSTPAAPGGCRARRPRESGGKRGDGLRPVGVNRNDLVETGDLDDFPDGIRERAEREFRVPFP